MEVLNRFASFVVSRHVTVLALPRPVPAGTRRPSLPLVGIRGPGVPTPRTSRVVLPLGSEVDSPEIARKGVPELQATDVSFPINPLVSTSSSAVGIDLHGVVDT